MLNTKITNTFASVSIGSMLVMSMAFVYMSVLIQRESSSEVFVKIPYDKVVFIDASFNEVIIQAQAAYVYDVTTGEVLYEKNASVPLPLASITKTMTAVVAEEEVEDLSKKIVIDRKALDVEGESGLFEGEQWKLGALLPYMLMSSSNDSAAAVAEAFPSFIDKMNTKARDLGLSSLSFNNSTGLDTEGPEETGGFGSAEDTALLFEYAIRNYPDLFDFTRYPSKDFSSDSFVHKAKNTNKAIYSVPNSIASKTGYTTKAGGNLVMAFDRGLNEPVIVVVLGSTYDGRFSDMESLASSTLKTYNQTQ